MGFFSSSPSTPPAATTPPAAAPPTSATADSHHFPSRTSRASCWAARDDFFACLTQNNIIDPIKEAKPATEKCGVQEQAFERECVSSWVEYFKKRRVMEVKKEAMVRELEKQGAQRM
ncbi:cytochrome oxidase c subunit VIb-domain-containing protein [Peziza echinospora]|nr:cytochrome oxidase c subunit VIb-domain-containing protein [Peziza echinospora]